MRVDPAPSRSCEHGFVFMFWNGIGIVGGIAMFLWVDKDIDEWWVSVLIYLYSLIRYRDQGGPQILSI